MNAKEFEAIYKEMAHFDRHLGMDLAVDGPGAIRYRLRVGEQHLSSVNACHGGVLAAMLDATLGMTALTWAVTHRKLCATVEFKTHFFAPVGHGDELEGRGTLDFTGSKLVVVSGEIRDCRAGHCVAKAIGTFTLYPLSKKAHLAELLAGHMPE